MLPDIGYTLSNGTTGQIDFTGQETTLGEILAEINAAAPGKLQAQIGPDGRSLQIRDLSGGTKTTFQLTSLPGSNALADLGLTGTASGGTITGGDLLGGLNSVLLSSLNGGQGVGALGSVSITNRAGVTKTVDLSQDQTLQSVINSINSAGAGVSAAVNQAGSGIEIDDTTGSTTGKLVIANGDKTDTATNLGIAVNAAVNSVNSGNMHLKVVSANTLLSSLNGARASPRGPSRLPIRTATRGRSIWPNRGSIPSAMRSCAINRLATQGLDIQASLNSAGDGIVITNTGSGSGKLLVQEGNSTTAADLHLLGGTQTVNNVQEVDGSTTTTIPITATDTLQSLVTKINNANGGLTASIFNDGSATPYRLELTSSQMGTAGQVVIDGSALPLSLTQTAQAQNAVLRVGGGSSSTGILTTSSNNVFTGVLQGASVTVEQASSQPVTVSIQSSPSSLESALQSLATEYNSFRSTLKTDTAYNTATNTAAVLTADPTAITLDSELSEAMSNNFPGTGTIQSLGQLGVSFNTDGTLSFDQSAFESEYSANPSAVQQFFTQTTTPKTTAGFSAAMHTLLTNLAGSDNSLLSNRVSSLGDTITSDNSRITEMNNALNQEQQDLYNQFDAMETAISQIQDEMQVVDTIGPLDATGSTSLTSNTSSSSGTLANLLSLG